MVKRSVEDWRGSLIASREYLKTREETLRRLQADIDRQRRGLELLERQIAEAERRGLTEFDDERLLILRQKR